MTLNYPCSRCSLPTNASLAENINVHFQRGRDFEAPALKQGIHFRRGF